MQLAIETWDTNILIRTTTTLSNRRDLSSYPPPPPPGWILKNRFVPSHKRVVGLSSPIIFLSPTERHQKPTREGNTLRELTEGGEALVDPPGGYSESSAPVPVISVSLPRTDVTVQLACISFVYHHQTCQHQPPHSPSPPAALDQRRCPSTRHWPIPRV